MSSSHHTREAYNEHNDVTNNWVSKTLQFS